MAGEISGFALAIEEHCRYTRNHIYAKYIVEPRLPYREF